MSTIADSFARALRHHQSGDLVQAETLYRQIIQADPGHAGAHLYLGLIEHAAGRHDTSIELIRRAGILDPKDAECHFNLGVIFMNLGKADEAIACFGQALRLNPRHARANNNLGIILKSQGHMARAAECFRQALRANPRHAHAHNNLGNTLREQGKLTEAIACYRQALECGPNLADVANNLGNALKQDGQAAEAIACYRQAVRNNPRHADSYFNLGLALKDQGELALAIAFFREVLRIDPRHVDAHHNLSVALTRSKLILEAVEHNTDALRINPAHAPALWQRSLLRLLVGDFERGWHDYEQRWALPNVVPRPFAKPRWDGSSLAGKTILVYSEQGLGDTIQFVRYLPLVQERGASVVFECQPAVLQLCGSVRGVHQLVAEGAPLPPFDVQVPLLSLPAVFGTTLATIPAHVPYLGADPGLVEHWRKELTPPAGFKVGIAWQGNSRNTKDPYRSVSLARFANLARMRGVHLMSLQVGPGAEQLAAFPMPITNLGSRFDPGSLNDLAAALMNLDLVVTVDTAVAHLSGALGVPVWILLPLGPDWRWMLERADSPWYPTMRLFRQSSQGDWNEVFDRVTTEVGALVESRKLANTLKTQVELGPAADGYRPALAEDNYNLATTLQDKEKLEEAATFYLQALRLHPDHPKAFGNLGTVRHHQGRLEEAIACYQNSISIRPDAKPYHNLANAFWQLRRLDEASHACTEAIRLDPEAPEPRFLRANLRLLCGNLEQGWPEYEWRWRVKDLPARPFAGPQWDGSPLVGRTILLHAEQGLGDTLQFIRYAPLLKQRGAVVVLACHRKMFPILKACPGVDRLVDQAADMPSFDTQAALMSLPGIVGTTLDNIPAEVPYLVADPELVERWRASLKAPLAFKVGIAWQGNPSYTDDRRRSIPLNQFATLCRNDDVCVVSLQKGPGTEQLQDLRFPVLDLSDRLDVTAAFVDTAALMMNLDLIITSDTAVAHLAGALGVPVWTLLPFVPDWRWLLERSDSPWYPTMRLFRQNRPADWQEVFERVAAEVCGLMSARMRSSDPERRN
ncbi:MAG TPA: tetratricopeptide repeat protein [Gemmataceae bacterium]|jgi:tetratricopeptide (TPR) repeat protein|nr:tetratricopeptide repeat protein [Gemmataceae bacterium]